MTFLLILPLSLSACSEPMPDGCIPVGNPKRTDGISKIEIHKPGCYCLTENLHARIEMADRWAERTMIVIGASNVVLDLQGHTVGRGRLFVNPGGVGILILDERDTQKNTQVRNITIKNGVLENFETGVARFGGFLPHRGSGTHQADYDFSLQAWHETVYDPVYDPVTKKTITILVENEHPIVDKQKNTYRFPRSNIRLENITFKDNKEDFRIHARTDVPPPDTP